MRIEPAMMSHDRGIARATHRSDDRKTFFDIAGFVFGILFFAFLLTGLSIATRAETPVGASTQKVSAFEFPEIE
jgi:hypothetical protein